MSSFETRPLSASTAELVSFLLKRGIDVRVRLSGWSMKPIVRSGSLLCFSSRDEPRLGDVVLTRLPNDAMVAHRVIAMDSENIWTKGDACRTADGPVPRSSVMGRAVRLEGDLVLPLSSFWMRAIGLAVNRVYPKVVAAYRFLVPRDPRGETASW